MKNLKFKLKNLFNHLGFEVKRIPKSESQRIITSVFTIRSTMKDSLRHLKRLGYAPDIILDVGAAEGTKPLLEVFPESYFYFIEPLNEFDENIKALLLEFKGKHIRAGASDKEEFIYINVHDDKLGSSIFKEVDGSQFDGLSREIEVFPLDKLLEEVEIPKKILLKIDAQGAELKILNGAKSILNYCDAIIIEVSFFNFLHDAPDFYDIVHDMKLKGFVVYDMFDGHNRPIDLALAQKDLLFVKERGIFRQTHNWGSTKQRNQIREVTK